MALPTCALEPSDFAAAIATQIPQLTWEMVQNIAKNDPYAAVFESGTFPNYQGDTIKTLIMDRVVTGHSLTRPNVVAATQACGTQGPTAQFGQSEFTTVLGNLRGESPLVCVKGARIVVEQGYQAATMAQRAANKEIVLADRRINLLDLAGLKYVAKAGGDIEANLVGGENQTNTNFGQGVPTAAMTFKALEGLADVLRYDYNNIQTFGDGADENFIVIAGSAQVNKWRDEDPTIENFRAAVTGGNKEALNQLWSYAFQPLYRGLRIGIDPKPLRFNQVDGSGNPVFIEPYIVDNSPTFGQAKNVINPAWKTAPYEVGFLISKGAFRYLTPTRLTKIGDMEWPSVAAPGQMEWINPQDLACNKYRDFGQFIWELERAIQPIVPHGVIPFLYTRCADALGLVGCNTDLGG
jgi:hypothetical protein